LAVVTIGTGRHGGTAEDEVTLKAVSAREAELLRTDLLRRTPASATPSSDPVPSGNVPPPTAVPAGPDPAGTLVAFDPRWLRYAPLTLMGLVAVGLLAGAGSQLARTLDIEVLSAGPVRDLFEWATNTPVSAVVALVAGVVLTASALLSVVIYVLLYWNFRLVRAGDGTLRVSYGLLTRRSVTIEERRIRGVRLDEPLLLRLGGGARCRAVATGLGARARKGDQLASTADLLLPQAPNVLAHQVVAEVLGVSPAPTTVPLLRHPAAAARRLILWCTVASALPAVLLGISAAVGAPPHWSWQAALLLLPVGAWYGWSAYRSLGHALTEDHLVSRRGFGRRTTMVLRRDGILGWRFRQTIFQRRAGLITVGALTAAGTGECRVTNVAAQDGLMLADTAVDGLLTPFLHRR
jgi:putative membrane protein